MWSNALPDALADPARAALLVAASCGLIGWTVVRPALRTAVEVGELREQVADLEVAPAAASAGGRVVASDERPSGQLAVDLAAQAQRHRLAVRSLPRPAEVAVGEGLALETFELRVVGSFADALRLTREIELGRDAVGGGRALPAHPVVHLRSAVVKDRRSRREELETTLIIRRIQST